MTGNSRLDVASLSLLLDRRLEDEKDRLLKNIGRVAKAPADADIMVSEKEAVTVSGITLTDDPSGKSVGKIDVRLEPRSLEEQLAAFHFLRQSRSDVKMPPSLLWECYEKRHSFGFSEDHRLLLATYGIVAGVPSFFWLQRAKKKDAREALHAAIEIASERDSFSRILTYGRLLPKTQFDAIAKRVPHTHSERLKDFLRFEKKKLDCLFQRPIGRPVELEKIKSDRESGPRR